MQPAHEAVAPPSGASRFALDQHAAHQALAAQEAALSPAVHQSDARREPSHVYDAGWFAVPPEPGAEPEPVSVPRRRWKRKLSLALLVAVLVATAVFAVASAGYVRLPA